jgi:hypothetical protein
LALRFALEVASLVALSNWALAAGDSSRLRLLAAVSLPLAAAVVWGTFAVPGDPSRNGRAPIRVRGWQRLGIELLVFAGGAAALAARAHWACFGAFVAALLAHHALTTARLRWLLGQ